MSSCEAGAEMMTFLAPASTWARALVASVKKPVDSTTTSTPSSPHLRLAGSRSAKAVMVWSLRDGMAIRLDLYPTLEQAMAALEQASSNR